MAMLTRASHAAVFLHVVMTVRGASLFIGWRMKTLRFGTMPQPAANVSRQLRSVFRMPAVEATRVG